MRAALNLSGKANLSFDIFIGARRRFIEKIDKEF